MYFFVTQNRYFYVLKKQIKKEFFFNLGSILCVMTAIYFIYYLLLKDDWLSLSIASMLSWTNHLTLHWHLLAIGMLPIYLAFIIFGTAIIGIYLGSAIQRWLMHIFHHKHHPTLLTKKPK